MDYPGCTAFRHRSGRQETIAKSVAIELFGEVNGALSNPSHIDWNQCGTGILKGLPGTQAHVATTFAPAGPAAVS